MSSLRSKLIRLAHQNPSLRADILPLLKEAGSKEASGGLIEYVLPLSKIEAVHHSLTDQEDEQSAELLMQVYYDLQKRFKLSDRENQAVNLIYRVITRPGDHRHNIFKAADALGMKLPSQMF
jgi:hypothetical protein